VTLDTTVAFINITGFVIPLTAVIFITAAVSLYTQMTICIRDNVTGHDEVIIVDDVTDCVDANILNDV
jgi:hypothetical protein